MVKNFIGMCATCILECRDYYFNDMHFYKLICLKKNGAWIEFLKLSKYTLLDNIWYLTMRVNQWKK